MPSTPPVALLVHGSGSAPDAARRLLGAAAPGWVHEAPYARGTLEDVVATIRSAVGRVGASGRTVDLVGGISLGAHAVAHWAAEQPGMAPDLVLAMPAWSGEPDGVAALTAASADEIERDGVGGILARLQAVAGHDWVVDELVRSWSDADPQALAASLRAAAASAAPTLDELARIRARTVVVALADDPLHPAAVAQAWADAIPRARLVVVPRDAPGTDRGALGRAARAVLDR